jgi:nucleoside-diphosphate-sugar epimerase
VFDGASRKLFFDVNVEGTRKLLDMCKRAGVGVRKGGAGAVCGRRTLMIALVVMVGRQRFVLTSSASVVFEGLDLQNGDESLPYAANPIDGYTETKAIQEKVCAGFDGLMYTCID